MTLREIERVASKPSVIDPAAHAAARPAATDEMYPAIEEHGDEFDARMGAEAVWSC